jgi:hypothetical protein
MRYLRLVLVQHTGAHLDHWFLDYLLRIARYVPLYTGVESNIDDLIDMVFPMLKAS